jgi:hypothetical protein
MMVLMVLLMRTCFELLLRKNERNTDTHEDTERDTETVDSRERLRTQKRDSLRSFRAA